jgi:L-fucose dehydrogenase
VPTGSLKAGETIRVGDALFVMKGAMGLGHKIAYCSIRAGEKVFKNGVPIGSATCDIAARVTCIFEETGELTGCEQIMAARVVDQELTGVLTASVEKAARYYPVLGHGSFAPGNADGGLYLLDVVPDGEPRFGGTGASGICARLQIVRTHQPHLSPHPPMNLQVQNHVVIVTGGAKGIGEAITRCFAEEGATVCIFGRNPEEGRQLAEACLAQGQRVESYHVGMTDEDAVRRAVAEVVERHGRIDVVVNNAGGNDAVSLRHSSAAFRASLEKNIVQCFCLVHHALDHLIVSRGNIVNIGSKCSVTGQGGIQVNCVIPAEVMTPLYERWLAQIRRLGQFLPPTPPRHQFRFVSPGAFGNLSFHQAGTPLIVAELSPNQSKIWKPSSNRSARN